MDSEAVAVWPAESVTLAVNVATPLVIGTPDTTPALERLRLYVDRLLGVRALHV